MNITKGLIATVMTGALLVVPTGALAKHDRDHDRMNDRWEHAHHLNTRANDARRDPDHDGLSNLSEFRHHTNPRAADTDRDGIKDGTEVRDGMNPRRDDSDDDGVDDGDEMAGTVVSFDNGVFTLQLARSGAGTVSGTVNAATRIECDEDDDAPAATTSRDGSDDNSGPGSGSDDHSGSGSDDTSGRGSDDSGTSGSDDGANHDVGDEHGDDGANHDVGDDHGGDDNTCTSADLKPGARVHEAKLTKTTDGSSVFTKIELVPAA